LVLNASHIQKISGTYFLQSHSHATLNWFFSSAVPWADLG